MTLNVRGVLGNWKFLYGANDLQKGVELLCWFQTVKKPKPNVCKTCSEVRADTVGAFTEQIMLNRQSRFVISTSFVRWKLELSYRMLKDLMENYCSHVPWHSIKVITQYITIPHTVTSRRRSRLPLTEKDPHTFLWWKLLRSDKLIPHRITQTIYVIHHRITSGTFIKLHVIRRKFNLFSSDAQTHLCPFDDLKNMEHCYRVSQGVEK